MASNKNLIEKADLTMLNIEANGGELNREQAARFVRKVIDMPTILRDVRVVEMRSPEQEINKIGFGRRILRPGVQGRENSTRLPDGDRARPTTEQVLLRTKEVIGEVHLPYQVFEDTIERGNIGMDRDGGGGTPAGGGIADTIVELIGERVALDLEELAVNGDEGLTLATAGTTNDLFQNRDILGTTGNPADNDDHVTARNYLAMQNGWLKLATENHVSVNTKFTKDVGADGIRAMPNRYKYELGMMRNYVAPNVEIDYRQSLTDRATVLGDQSIDSQTTVARAMGVPLSSVNTMPPAQGLLCNPKNLIFGIQRRVTMEFDKDIRARLWIIVVTARVDFQIEETESIVKYTDIQQGRVGSP